MQRTLLERERRTQAAANMPRPAKPPTNSDARVIPAAVRRAV
jgi:hypothetical protein